MVKLNFQWMTLEKIMAYLTEKEGHTLVDVVDYSDSDNIQAVLQDAFGFRYQVTVKKIGRINIGNDYDFVSTLAPSVTASMGDKTSGQGESNGNE